MPRKGKRTTGDIGPFLEGVKMAEKVFQGAIILGLNNARNRQDTHPLLKAIWCPKYLFERTVVNPRGIDYIPVINQKSGVIGRVWEKEEIQKTYDLAWTDRQCGRSVPKHPDWYCQIKPFVTSHDNLAKALGDLFWGYVDREYLRTRHDRNVELVCIWAEPAPREDDRFIHFEENQGEMEFKLEPGYSEYKVNPDDEAAIRMGNVEFNDFGVGNPGRREENWWWDRDNAILHPNNVTAVKQILGSGTNASFYRMYRQPGCLTLKTEYRQLSSQCGNWHVYIHRLTSGILEDAGGIPFFEWIM